MTLIATQGFISDKDGSSYASDNSYFSNLLSFYIGMQDKRTPAVVRFVRFSDTKVSSKDKVEHVLTNNCVKLTNNILIGDSGASSHMSMTTNGMFDLKDCKILV